MAGITAKELASILGISPAAVSLALNGKPGVSEATRSRVLSAAEIMGYDEEKLAVAVSRKKRICFVVYVDKLVSLAENTTFSSFVLQGIQAAAASSGHNIMVRYVHAEDSLILQLHEISREVDGFIILGTDITEHTEPQFARFLHAFSGTPTVLLDYSGSSLRTDSVTCDNYGGAKAAGEYLLSRGCLNIGYIRSRFRSINFRQREAGLTAALTNAGRSLFCTIDSDVSIDNAFNDISDWLTANSSLPDAFFAENDIIGAAAIRALRARDISVPEQVSIIGFDDLPLCDRTEPPLTTVISRKEQIGETAMGLLLHRFHNRLGSGTALNQGALHVSVSSDLHVRDSVR